MAKDLVGLSVFTTIYEEDSEEVKIKDFHLVQYDGDVIQIQVYFASPELLSLTPTEPEQLVVVFKENLRSLALNV